MLQSMYWVLRSCSIFISIASVLDPNIYYGAYSIKEEDEVTVEIPGRSAFWAEVIKVEKIGAHKWYTVQDENGTITDKLSRACIFKRVWVSIAYVGFTGDKKHDSYATQHFMDKCFQDIHARLERRYPGYTFPKAAIHSDNAASHFKNSRSKHWLSNVPVVLFAVLMWSYSATPDIRTWLQEPQES